LPGFIINFPHVSEFFYRLVTHFRIVSLDSVQIWSRGYCVSTVGLDEDKIRKYVKWQEKKEKEVEQVQKGLFD